jgi:hypothetical protein
MAILSNKIKELGRVLRLGKIKNTLNEKKIKE